MSGVNKKAFLILVWGICFDDEDIVQPIVGEQRVFIRSCETEHDNEVFSLFDLDLDAFPGSEKIQDVSVAECLLYFKNYVGKDYVESIVDITTLSPTVESWDSGDREVACLAYDMNKNKLNVSVKNSKL